MKVRLLGAREMRYGIMTKGRTSIMTCMAFMTERLLSDYMLQHILQPRFLNQLIYSIYIEFKLANLNKADRQVNYYLSIAVHPIVTSYTRSPYLPPHSPISSTSTISTHSKHPRNSTISQIKRHIYNVRPQHTIKHNPIPHK